MNFGRTYVGPSGGTGGGGGGITAINVSAGTTNNNLTNLVFADSFGITFGLDASTITASHNGMTSQSNQNVTAGNGGFAFQTLSFSNANGFTFGTSAGSAIFGSYTVPTVTNSSWTVSDNATSITVARLAFTNLNGMTLSLSTTTGGSATVVGSYTVPTVTNSSWTVSDTATSGTVARLAFTNLNGVTFSLSTGAAGLHTIVGSHNGLTSQSNQAFSAAGGSSAFQTLSFGDTNGVFFTNTNGSVGVASVRLSMFAVSNTTQSSSGTANHSALSFAGAGIASVGVTGGSVLISVPAGGGGGDGGVFAGVSTGGNTAGSTGTVSTGNFVLVGSNGITLSQSTGAAGSAATVTIFGETKPYASAYKNFVWLANSQTQTVGNSTSVMIPFIVNDDRISFTWLRNLKTVSLASTSFASTANAVYSYQQAVTYGVQVYTRETGASSLSLGRILSTTAGMTWSIRLSRNTTNNISVTHGLTYPLGVGTSSSSFSYAATNSSDQFSTTHMTALSGAKMDFIPFAATLSQGKYYLLSGYSTTQTTQSTANLSAGRILWSNIAASQPNLTVAPFANANAGIYQMDYLGGPGSVTVVGGATTASLALTQISSSSSHNVPWFALELLD